jgi:4-hydroxy-tetrahydrodipicolinate synthase
MKREKITGIVPVLPTPFDPEQHIDCPSLKRLVRFCAKNGFSAICLPAYAGEFYKLSEFERTQVVECAIEAADGDIQVIAQSNHYAGLHAASIASANEQRGADAVSVAVPRMFEISEADVYQFVVEVAAVTSLPVLVQDFNPGGPTMSAETAKRLHADFPNFRYLKLEQPLMAPKVAEILEATDGGVQVLEGWGGMYLLEGIAAGICGAMPALGVADILQRVYDLATADGRDAAMDLFQEVLPYLAFSLQNMELLLQMEKRLLVRRGLVQHDTVRQTTLTLDPHTDKYVDFLIDRLMHLFEEPADASAAPTIS